MKTFWRVAICGLFIGLAVATVGCEYFPESTFQLANESRLPKWITVPPGATRADVSLEMSYYVKPWGREAVFILRDKQGKTLAKVSGRDKGLEPLQLKKNLPEGSAPGYPSYEVITANGVTEIMEHKKMEPIFYVTDDPAVWKELMGSRSPAQP